MANKTAKRPTADEQRKALIRARDEGRNKSEAHARERANVLVLHLMRGGWGNKWRAHVWENLGWHYSVSPFARRHSGTEFDIHPDNDHEPLGPCWVSFIPNGGKQIHVNAKSPAEAIEAIRVEVLRVRTEFEKCFKTVRAPKGDK